jgi:hypothetical protein
MNGHDEHRLERMSKNPVRACLSFLLVAVRFTETSNLRFPTPICCNTTTAEMVLFLHEHSRNLEYRMRSRRSLLCGPALEDLDVAID